MELTVRRIRVKIVLKCGRDFKIGKKEVDNIKINIRVWALLKTFSFAHTPIGCLRQRHFTEEKKLSKKFHFKNSS